MLLIFKALFENNSVFVYSSAVTGANLQLIGAVSQGTCGEVGGAAITVVPSNFCLRERDLGFIS